MTYMMPLADGETPCPDCTLSRGQWHCTMNCSPRKWTTEKKPETDQMPGRLTLERVQRDDEDADGSSIREWHVCAEAGSIFLRRHKGSNSFITLKSGDIKQLYDDLLTIDAAQIEMEKPQ